MSSIWLEDVIRTEIWACLEENFLHSTEDREVQLTQRMQDLKLSNQSLTEYLKAFKNIFDGLAAIQKSVPDEDKLIYMSRGLGKKYSVLVTSMLAKLPFPSTHNLSQRFRIMNCIFKA
eukprot:TRINITY_DN18756_c0_g1_i1.p1 TRINITY_DN18756_c0_g1~~TRINITY_DN18756_c0_g1_i1.p1  ORF type:complete len:118 (+),score=11.76 TRINITY_DN18756_c0_g1_i1:42-395(+)